MLGGVMKKVGVGLVVAGLATGFAGFLGVGYAGAAANPPGNNGTVKIEGEAFDRLHDNDPHVGCAFFVQWYGFDAGTRTTTVTFTAQAPTGSGETLLADTFDFTGSGSGNQLDAQVSYDLTAALAAYSPQPQQGFHVKLTVNTDGAQGSDVKHKVFWVSDCSETSSSSSTSSSDSDSTSSSVIDSSSSTDSTSSSSSSTSSSSSGSTSSTGVLDSSMSSSSAVLAVSSSSPPADTRSAVLGAEVSRSASLPRTGMNPMALMTVGLLLAFVGASIAGTGARLARRIS
jgi:hypothetical protein